MNIPLNEVDGMVISERAIFATSAVCGSDSRNRLDESVASRKPLLIVVLTTSTLSNPIEHPRAFCIARFDFLSYFLTYLLRTYKDLHGQMGTDVAQAHCVVCPALGPARA